MASVKIYVVLTDYGYDSRNFEAAFSTQEKAEAFIERLYGKNSSVAWWEETELDNP